MRSLAVGAILAGSGCGSLHAQSLDARLPTCFACHGENGTSQLPDTPRSARNRVLQHGAAAHVPRQAARHRAHERDGQGLTDDELRKAGDIISKLPPPVPVADNPDPAAWSARAPSHPEPLQFLPPVELSGQDNVPRLAGQREDYLLKALRGYKDNSRRGYDAQMSEVVYDLKDEDFVELAYFLARQK
jgi:cytochrome c553